MLWGYTRAQTESSWDPYLPFNISLHVFIRYFLVTIVPQFILFFLSFSVKVDTKLADWEDRSKRTPGKGFNFFFLLQVQ